MKFFSGILFVLLLSFLAIQPLLQKGFFPMHDDVQVVRVHQMHKSLADGMFPARWVEDLGYSYGYPIFNFYAPFAYYVGGVSNFLIDDVLISTKVMIAFGILLAGVTMYLLAKEFWGEVGGVVSALFYVYAPYHALNVYVRGAIAETWAYGFVPLVFFGLYKIYDYSIGKNVKLEKSKKSQELWVYVAIAASGYAGVILSHNLTAMMITPFVLGVVGILSYCLYKNHKLLSIRYLMYAFFIGLLLASFYWLPSLVEMKYTNVSSQVGGGADFSDHFVCLSQLWDGQWAFGGSVPGCVDGLSFKIGKFHALGAMLALALSLIFLRKDRTRLFGALFSGVSVVVAIFFMLQISEGLWKLIGPMAYFQFPWRFLLLASFFTSFLVGSLVYISDKIFPIKAIVRYTPVMTGSLLVIVLLGASSKLFSPQEFLDRSTRDYANAEKITFAASKISDEYMPKEFAKPQNPSQVPKMTFMQNEAVEIRSLDKKTNKIIATITSQGNTNLHANIAYFPAWKAYVHDREVGITPNNSGFVFSIPKGESNIVLAFVQTPVEKIANILSLSGVLLLFIGIIRSIWRPV